MCKLLTRGKSVIYTCPSREQVAFHVYFKNLENAVIL